MSKVSWAVRRCFHSGMTAKGPHVVKPVGHGFVVITVAAHDRLAGNVDIVVGILILGNDLLNFVKQGLVIETTFIERRRNQCTFDVGRNQLRD